MQSFDGSGECRNCSKFLAILVYFGTRLFTYCWDVVMGNELEIGQRWLSPFQLNEFLLEQ